MQTLGDLSRIFGEDTPVMYILIDRDLSEALQEMDEELCAEQRAELLERVADAQWPGKDVMCAVIEHELKKMKEEKSAKRDAEEICSIG